MDAILKQIQTAQCLDVPIDGRKLQLKLSFYGLSLDSTWQLIEDIHQWQSAFLSPEVFVCNHQRRISGKRVYSKFSKQDLSNFLLEGKAFFAGTSAWVKTPQIYNQKTVNEYLRFMQFEWRPTHTDLYRSKNYLDAWNTLFPTGRPDPEEIRLRIWRLFCAEHKSHTGWCTGTDVSAALRILPYESSAVQVHGQYSFHICNYCLCGQTQAVAELLRDFAEYISNSYSNVNARIMLQPEVLSDGPYRKYFNQLYRMDNSHLAHNCKPSEWYDSYYLQGVEWCNIISPRAQIHLPSAEIQKNVAKTLIIRQLPGGGRMVCSPKFIHQYGVPDALEMKKSILPALYPGWSSIPLRVIFPKHGNTPNYSVFPRTQWEIVPVFEDEIEVIGNTDLCFYSRNCGVQAGND